MKGTRRRWDEIAKGERVVFVICLIAAVMIIGLEAAGVLK